MITAKKRGAVRNAVKSSECEGCHRLSLALGECFMEKAITNRTRSEKRSNGNRTVNVQRLHPNYSHTQPHSVPSIAMISLLDSSESSEDQLYQ